jgi:putative ABC transport system ATP-binding protein
MKNSDGKPGSPLIELRGVNKEFISPGGKVKVLNNINLTIKQGEFVAIVGKSGSGKSTLLNMITGIDRQSSGEVLVVDTHLHLLPEGPLAAWRGRTIGIVFQFFQLLPTLSVAENIMLPMDFAGVYPVNKRRERALALLGQVGIIEQADKLPSSLSGGQQQRAAIARALANDPPLMVADEPTGNLDGRTAGDVIRLFSNLASSGKTVVIVTHERDVTTFADRAIVLSDGSVESELKGARSLKNYEAQEATHA